MVWHADKNQSIEFDDFFFFGAFLKLVLFLDVDIKKFVFTEYWT